MLLYGFGGLALWGEQALVFIYFFLQTRHLIYNAEMLHERRSAALFVLQRDHELDPKEIYILTRG